jgi:hypothetical protein
MGHQSISRMLFPDGNIPIDRIGKVKPFKRACIGAFIPHCSGEVKKNLKMLAIDVTYLYAA